MRRFISLCAVLALLALGATGCTALMTGGKKNNPEQAGLESGANGTQLNG